MGGLFSSNKLDILTDLEDYQQLTYLTRNEIIHIYGKFVKLGTNVNKHTLLQCEVVANGLDELKENPFKDRICSVFSSQDNKQTLSFEDFLEILSVFSHTAPFEVKSDYAFKIYDFDSDEKIDKNDLRKIIDCLTGDNKMENHMKNTEQIIENVLDEADLDEDGFLSYSEFHHVLSKAPDFLNLFRMKV